MPAARGAAVSWQWTDHDSDEIDQDPPVQNTWYTIMDRLAVALLWCRILQNNDELAAKDIEVRWTVDGNVYLRSISMANNTGNFIYRMWLASNGGTAGLLYTTSQEIAVRYAPKHGHDFKVEARITSALGTNQRLRGYCVPEILTAYY